MGRFKFNEKAGLWYEFNGEYYLPCLAMPEEEHRPIGKWGRRHRDFLKRHRKATYISLLTTGTVDAYLADLDEQAAERFERLVSQMAEKQGVDESGLSHAADGQHQRYPGSGGGNNQH